MFELAPASGFRPLEKLRKEMDDLFSRFARSDWPSPGGKDADAFVPAMDVKETETAIEVEIEVAGLKPEEIEVSLSGDMLTVKGEKKERREESKEGYRLVERRFGSFQRSFRLPAAVERDKVEAIQKDGLLRLSIPKSQPEPVTKIAIKAE